MSQSQVQQRPAATNGVGGRRRADRDVGNARADSGFRSDSQNWRSQAPSRSGSGASAAPGSAHGPTAISRNSGERTESGTTSVARGGTVLERPLHDRLLFMAMCLIGQPVEVQVKNGSFYSGIFHTANVEKDFGIVLKMARLTRDGSVKGGKSEAVKEAARKAPQKTLTIHAKDFVQIIAKDVSLTGDALPNGRARENKAEIVTDAILSQSRQRDMERELKPWKPDDEAPKAVGLESTFQGSWRNWDQFETNKTLFGVETTFNEELYTTKLERGPQMREREREASRIAREIEGTATKNLHLAEERGIRLAPELEAMDEESRFSSVIRAREKVDVGEDGEDRQMDDRNEETFGSSFTGAGGSLASPSDSTVSTPLTGESESKQSRPSSADSTQAGGSPYHSPVGRGSPLLSPLVGDAASIQALNLDPSCPQVPEEVYREFHEFKLQETAKKGKKQREDHVNELKSFSESLKKKELEPRSPRATPKVSVVEPISSSRHVPQDGGARPSAPVDAKSIVPSSVPAGLLTTAQASAPPASAVPIPMVLGSSLTNAALVPKAASATSTVGNSFDIASGGLASGVGSSVTTSATGQSVSVLPPNGLPILSSISTNFGAPSSVIVPSVSYQGSPSGSPTSSVSSSGAQSGSKKSTLNPNAKEFKLNPHAKAFTPNFSSPRSASPMIQGQVYMHSGLSPVPQMPGMNVGQYMQQPVQQPGQPSQFTLHNNAMAAAAAASSSQYMPPPGSYSGGSGPPVLPGQPGLKLQPHSQQQVVGPPYGQQQQLRYPPQGHPMQPQPTYLHHNGQLYPQQMMYGQQPLLYIQQFPQMMQGQPVPPPQGPLPPQPSQQSQQQKHRGGGIQPMHYQSGAPSFLPGQHHIPQPQLPHLHNSLQPAPGGLPPASMSGVQPPQQVMVNPSGSGGGGNGVRGGGKGGGGSFSQQ